MRLATRISKARVRPARLRSARGLAIPPAATDTFGTSADLRQRVLIALEPDYSLPYWQWGWTDITEYVRWDPGIDITYGRQDERNLVTSLSASMDLENDGRFSRRNPFGAYANKLTRNTPVWASVNPGSGWYDRLHGYINSWPKRWDSTGTDSIVPVSIGGVMRRLEQSENLYAPLHAAVLADGPDAMWALDDGASASNGASALPGGRPMTASLGTPAWAAIDPPAGGSNPLASIDDTVLRGDLVSTATTAWSFELIANTVELGAGLDGYIASVVTNADASGALRFQIFTQTAFPLPLAVEVNGGLTLSASGQQADFDLEWHHYLVNVVLSGTNVNGELWYDGQLIASGNFFGGASSLLTPRRMELNSAALDTMAVGYAAVHPHADVDAAARYQAMLAWVGEGAIDRMRRVCSNAQVPFYCGDSSTTTLGPQPVGTLMEVLRDAEKADGGVLFEDRFGFGYKPLRGFYNQPVHLPLDQAAGQLAGSVEADDSDQDYTNQWTALRADGSSSTFRDPDYRSADGLFAGSDTYNVETDAQLPDISGWQVGVGTIDEDRWPRIEIDLANHPELIPYWVNLPFGGRVQVSSPHEEVGVDEIDAIVQGWSEHWNSKLWSAAMNTTPASIYNVPAYDSGTVRYGARRTVLAAAISATDTAIVVNSNGETWATTASHPTRFPANVDIGGITYRCTGITGTAPTYTLAIDRLATDRAHDAGVPVRPTDTGKYGR